MGNPKKRPIISPRKTAFLLIFSMLLSVFTVFPSFAEGSGGGEVIPALPDTALSDVSLAEPSVNIETETMQTETAVASAVTSTPVKVETANTTISTQYGVDMEKDETQNIHVFTGSSVQSITARSNKSAVVSCQTPENIATGFYAVPIQAKQVGIATITVDVTYNGGATETVSIEIYVVMEDGVYAIKSNVSHLPTDMGNYYLRAENPTSSQPNIIISTHTYGGVPGNIYRYWSVEYASHGKYYIRCIALPYYSLLALGDDITIMPGSTDAHQWKLRYRRYNGSGTNRECVYQIESGKSSYSGEGLILDVLSEQIGMYDTDSYYYYVPITMDTLADMAFDQWIFETVDINGVYFRNNSSGNVTASFAASRAVVEGETIELNDLGYSYLEFGDVVPKTPIWSSSSPSVATVHPTTGVVTAVGAGTTTVTVAVDDHYASFTLTLLIKPLADGTYFLRNLETGLYADIQNGSMTNGNEVEQQTFDGASTQKWNFVYYGGGNIYTIRSAQNNSYYLGVENNSTDDGANIVLRTGSITSGMKWRVTKCSQGYKISAYSSSSRVVAAGSSSAGENLTLTTWTNDTNYQDEWDISRYDLSLIALPEGYDRSSYFDRIANNLRSVGYSVSYNNHQIISQGMTKNDLLLFMQKSRITLIRTHGSKTSITVSDGSLTRSDLLALTSNALAYSDLIIYGACLTAQGGANGTNLVSATVAAGAQTVIGFENSVEASACNLWCEKFFEFYVTAYSDTTKDYNWVCSQTDSKASTHRYYEYTDSDGDLVSLRNYVIAGSKNLSRD